MVPNEGEGCTWFRAIMVWQLAREFIAENQESAGVLHVQFWQMSFQRILAQTESTHCSWDVWQHSPQTITNAYRDIRC
eukprot:1879667-Amphidinium_carterae.1